MTRIFNYRVVNDNLEVAKCTFDLLITGLYPEELLNQNTDELIASTPKLNEPVSRVGLKGTIFALSMMVGVFAAAAYIYQQKKQ